VEKFLKFFKGFGLSEGGVLIVLLLSIFLGISFSAPTLSARIFSFLIGLLTIWMPVILAILFWKLWINYVRTQFISNQNISVLEVKIPREISKSPKAMEAVFEGLHISIGETTFINRWIEGKVRTWYSFELVSTGGQIHFYIWTRSFFKDIVEAQIYAQYPEVEIYEVEDYAKKFKYDASKHNAWGCDFKLDEDDVFPIKTYIDYGLDKDPKEEYIIDPIAHLFEYLSTIKEGEQAWIQILIRTNKDKRRKKDKWFEKESKWKGEAKDKISEIYADATPDYPAIAGEEGERVKGFAMLTPSDKEKVEAVGRSITKKAYDVGIRALHFGPREGFRGINTVAMLGIFKQFGSENLNTLSPTRWLAGFVYPWEDFRNIRQERLKVSIFDAFQRRSWFHVPYKTSHFVLTTEELATIYHFPSGAIVAPGLERIPATKSAAPPNLPI
jgi:hypothetical protein